LRRRSGRKTAYVTETDLSLPSRASRGQAAPTLGDQVTGSARPCGTKHGCRVAPADAAAGNATSARTLRCPRVYRLTGGSIRYAAQNAGGDSRPREREGGRRADESLRSRSASLSPAPSVLALAYAGATRHLCPVRRGRQSVSSISSSLILQHWSTGSRVAGPNGRRVRQAEHAAQPETGDRDSSRRLPTARFGSDELPLAFCAA
jgi:hypothetical protein